MRRKTSSVVLLLALLLGSNTAYGQDSLGAKPKKARTPDDYKPRSLKEIAATGADPKGRVDKEEGVITRSDILPSRVRVVRTGSARPLPQIKKEVLLQWARLYAGYPEGFTAPYETEMLFIEDGKEHWLAVKKSLVAELGKDLKEGEAVDLHVIRLGEARTSGEWEMVLLVESFQKLK